MVNENLERLLDLVAEALIISPLVQTPQDVEKNQTFIRNGLLQKGTGEGVLALFQREIKANQEDLQITYEDEESGEILSELEYISTLLDFELYSYTVDVTLDENSQYQINLNTNQELPDEYTNLTKYVQQGDEFSQNPLNVSQFISLQQSSSVVNVEQAEEFLDTNIFELLPDGDARQARIVRFFQELNALLPPAPGENGQPPFDFPDDDDDRVNRDENFNWVSASLYDQNTSISYAQDNQDGNIDEEDAFIHRLKSTANDTNQSLTIEDIYNTIEPYLTDILEPQTELQDDRPEYTNKSSGYLQFRNLNQGIIIRNTNQDFIEGLNPNNPTYLNTDGTGGFTITMWVRFLDKVSEGTLFNFGNPVRDENPFGFKLETLINPDDKERYARLLLWNGNRYYDSHLGINGVDKVFTNTLDSLNDIQYQQWVNIPQDFNEWYFICASYNPLVNETFGFDNQQLPANQEQVQQGLPFGDGEQGQTEQTIIIPDTLQEPNFWLNHIDQNALYTNYSGFGNQCKVEIISRTDLLRARGFKI
tara:strand:+ start:135 stop:1739 length:1605 start_codon:yes stop_codon:yes gene_type:complete